MRFHNREISPHISFILQCLFALGGLFSSAAIALQALATHLPDSALPVLHGREMLHTAADIALWHGIALCALPLARPYMHPSRLALGCIGLAIGTFLFSGSVTLHGFGILFPARLAPIGGSLLILSWLCIASSAFISNTTKTS